MTLTLAIRNGTFTTPIYANEPKAKNNNWVALISAGTQAHARGGLLRDWFDEIAPATFEADRFRVGEAIEFGAESLKDGPKGGKQSKRVGTRRWGVVRLVERDRVEIEEYGSAEAALVNTDRAKARASGHGEALSSLQRRLAELRDRGYVLEEQLAAINSSIHELEAELSLAELLGEPVWGEQVTE